MISLFQPPPNQLKAADFWRIQLTNLGQEPLQVFLRSTAEVERDGRVAEARSVVFTLPPGTLTITARHVEPITEIQSHARYKGILERTGNVPAGNYIVCAYVHLAATGEELGRDCIEQIVEILAPPVLLAPADGETVEEKLPVFTWLPPVPVPGGQNVEYVLTIAEILGRQSPFDALQSNPSWYLQTGLRRTLFQYPIAARNFQAGRYAWKVEAFSDGFKIGESETWEFEYTSGPATLRAEAAKFGQLHAKVTEGFIPSKLLNELLRSCHGN